MSRIKSQKVKSNGRFSIIRYPYDKPQHPNQQGGLDRYVDVLDHISGRVNTVKLYENSKGMHFKKNGLHYLSDFAIDFIYVKYQIIEDLNSE